MAWIPGLARTKGNVFLIWVGLMGLCFTWIVYSWQKSQLLDLVKTDIQWAVRERAHSIQRMMDHKLYELKHLYSPILNRIDEQTFQSAVSHLFDQFPDMQALYWFSSLEEGNHYGPFQNKETPAGQLDLEHLKPLFDLARDESEPVVDLLRHTDHPTSLIIVTAAYQDGLHYQTVAQRRAGLVGFSVGVLDVGMFVEAAIHDLRPHGIRFWLSRGTLDQENAIYFHDSRMKDGDLHDQKLLLQADIGQAIEPLKIGNQLWLLTGEQDTGYPFATLSSDRLMLTLVGGCLSTCLFVLLLYFQKNHLNALNDHSERMELAKKRTDDLISFLPVPLVVTDLKGVVWRTNHAFCELIGWDKDEPIHLSLGQVLGGTKLFSEDMLLVPSEPCSMFGEAEIHIVHKTGRKIPIRISRTVLQGVERSLSHSHGIQVSFVFLLHDMTEQKIYAEQMNQALSMAEAASRSKSRFIASMSHEIRTPINAVMGLSDLALKSAPPPPFRDYLVKIGGASHTLLSLVNDILDFSRAESGQMRLDPTEFRMGDLFGRLGDLFGGEMVNKPVELIFDLPPDYCPSLYGDALRLERIFTNLIRNAIKFTEEGGILIRAEPIRDPIPGVVRLDFSVWDTGIGIAQESLPLLFEPFVQADSSITRKYGGTGLGLTICKQLAEMLGGEIHVQSELGKGSCFRFHVMMACQSTQGERFHTVPGGVQNKKILVVDDSPIFLDIMGKILSSWSFEFLLVESGLEAIEQIRKADRLVQPFDLVILDWRMPGMDGIETSRRIKAEFCDQPKILLLTAFGDHHIEQLAFQVGVAQFLRKPVTPSQLFDGIMAVFGKERKVSRWSERSQLEETMAKQVLAGIDILLVEDNAINQQVARELLQRVGVVVTVAENGQAALDWLENKVFDGVLMDLQMPVMGGVESTIRIRQCPHLEGLPIIAMTAHALDEARQECLEAGMDDFLTKPIQPNRLYALLAHWIPKQSSAIKPIGEESGEEVIQGEAERALSDIPGVDKLVGLAYTGGNALFLETLFRRFAEQQCQAAEQIKLALDTGRMEEAKRIVHTIKGLSGSLGAQMLQQTALALEEAILQQGNHLVTQNHLKNFTLALKTILDAVADWPPLSEMDHTTTQETVPENPESIRMLLTELADLVRQGNTETDAVMESLKKSLSMTKGQPLLSSVEEKLAHFSFDAALQEIEKIASLLGITEGGRK